MAYWVYILRCCDGSLYTGHTADLKKRLNEQKTGKGSSYVKGRLPARLAYCEKHLTRSSAMKREIEIKRWSRGKKEQLLEN